MDHLSCGQSHAPFTPCPAASRALLAEEARHLAQRIADLERRVTSAVDRAAGWPANRARIELDALGDLLGELD